MCSATPTANSNCVIKLAHVIGDAYGEFQSRVEASASKRACRTLRHDAVQRYLNWSQNSSPEGSGRVPEGVLSYLGPEFVLEASWNRSWCLRGFWSPNNSLEGSESALGGSRMVLSSLLEASLLESCSPSWAISSLPDAFWRPPCGHLCPSGRYLGTSWSHLGPSENVRDTAPSNS